MAKPSQHTSLGLTLLPIRLWFTAMTSLSILRPSREPSGFGTSPFLGGSTHGPLSCRLFPHPPTLGLFRCRFGFSPVPQFAITCRDCLCTSLGVVEGGGFEPPAHPRHFRDHRLRGRPNIPLFHLPVCTFIPAFPSLCAATW